MMINSKFLLRVQSPLSASLGPTCTGPLWRPDSLRPVVQAAVAAREYSTANAANSSTAYRSSSSGSPSLIGSATPVSAFSQANPTAPVGGLFGGGTTAPLPVPEGPLPADLDAGRFRVDPSAAYWQTFRAEQQQYMSGDETLTTTAGIQKYVTSLVQRIGGRDALANQQSMAYWAYHTTRLTFFIGQAIAGVVAHYAFERLSSFTAATSDPAAAKTPLERLAAGGQKELVSRINEAVGTWTNDLAAIRAGSYQMPWDMVTASHRQYNPLYMARRTLDFVQEASGTLSRRMRAASSSTWLSSASKMYPSYFTNSYHFQADGWLSARSADVYEHSTETLFFGRQDAMQRTALLPLAQHLAGKDHGSMRLLELAAGTGRFHTFIKDNYPEMQTVCSDLSPFYLAKARENVLYWKSQRQRNRSLGGLDDTGVEFVQTAAEDIAAPDASYDVVVCVYLFHEIPEAVRAKVAAEMFRVLKPGGMAVLTDSVQYGDRPDWDRTLGLFGSFQEPYWNSYISTDLGALFEQVGFSCDAKYVNSSTKTLSFIKPMSAPSSSQNALRRPYSDSDRITSYYQ